MVDSTIPPGLAAAFALEPRRIIARPGRMFSIHYHVADTSGSEWFLKCSPEGQQMEHLDLQFSLHDRLQQHGVPVPVMRPTLDGRSGCLANGRLYACYSFMPSERAALVHDGEAAGILLGRVHQATQGMLLPGKVWARSIHDVRQIRDDIMPWLDSRVRESPDPLDRLVQLSLPEIRTTLADLPELSASLAPRQPLHGDFNPQNIVIFEGHVTGCLDFGDSVTGHPIEDVAEALFYFGGIQKQELWTPDGVLARRFLRGYLSIAPIAPEWLKSLPRVLRAQCLRQLSKYTARWDLFRRIPGLAHYISRLLIAIAQPGGMTHPWNESAL